MTRNRKQKLKVRSEMETASTCYLQAARTLSSPAIEERSTPAIPTALPALTSLTNGWAPGEVILVSGRPGTGKTTFAVASAAAALEAYHSVLFISPELDEERITYRVVSSIAGVTPREFSYQVRTSEQDSAIAEAELLLAKINFAALATNNLSVVEEAIRGRVRTEAGLSLVIIDGVEAFGWGGDRFDERAAMAATLRKLATSLGITMLLTAAAPRSAALQNQASINACGGGTDLLVTADFVLGLANGAWDRGEPEAYRPATLTVVKNRQGPVGASFPCYLNPLHLRFQEEAW